MNNQDLNNAIALSDRLIKRGEFLSSSIKEQIQFDTKHKIKRDYKKDFDLLDEIISKTKKLQNLINEYSPEYSFAEQNDKAIINLQIREGVVTVAKQLKSISSFLLKMIAKETQQLIDKDYSLLLKKIESSMKIVNSEVKIYKDETTWLLAETQINYGKNGSVRNQIGSKVPMLGRLIDALELKMQKESKENSAIDHTKLLINLVASLKSFGEDLKQYRNDPNAPVIQINKLFNKLTGSSFAFKGNYKDVYGLAGISVDEVEILLSESDPIIPNKLSEDRNELHKLILSVKEKDGITYQAALNKIKGKK
ncbi:MAG TPA: hypothetical protein DHV28_13635 [Ignavibacteriales bacterium]|nr:hypothetical protein [Ignavibacteriales bacterium]